MRADVHQADHRDERAQIPGPSDAERREIVTPPYGGDADDDQDGYARQDQRCGNREIVRIVRREIGGPDELDEVHHIRDRGVAHPRSQRQLLETRYRSATLVRQDREEQLLVALAHVASSCAGS
jgi:hypothetical protein